MIGKSERSPLFNNILRVFVVSYVMLAMAKSAEEQRPCAIIIVILAFHPQFVPVINPVVISPICPTDEYAIRDFRSDCRIQIIAVITAPHILNVEKKGIKVEDETHQ
jgi:hypothetical protein